MLICDPLDLSFDSDRSSDSSEASSTSGSDTRSSSPIPITFTSTSPPSILPLVEADPVNNYSPIIIFESFKNFIGPYTSNDKILIQKCMEYMHTMFPSDLLATTSQDIVSPQSVINRFQELMDNRIRVFSSNDILFYLYFKSSIIVYNNGVVLNVLHDNNVITNAFHQTLFTVAKSVGINVPLGES